MGCIQLWRRRLGLLGEAFLEDLLSTVYPALCPLCAADSSLDCGVGGCNLHRLPQPGDGLPGPRCDRCARALPPMLPDGTRCAPCRRRPPRVVRVVALGDYRSCAALRHWILAFKHGGRRDLGGILGGVLAARLLAVDGAPGATALLIPVPLHPLRRFQRGFDQANCLAQAAAEVLGLRCEALLQRRRWTAPQGAPGSPARGANVHAAFDVPKRRRLDLRGHSVWLVDDVCTSGATLEACAEVLTQLGARRIGALCLARAGEPEMFA